MALFGGQGQLDTPEDLSIYSSPNLPSTFVDSQAVFNNSNYKPLQINHSGVSRRPREGPTLNPSRMNLAVGSKRTPYIFLASGSNLEMIPTPTGLGVCDLERAHRTIPCPHPRDDTAMGYIDPNEPYAIDNIHVGELGGEEVVVTVNDCGQVAVHFPRDNFSRSPILLKVPQSAWGIDTHSEKRLLAISCNALVVTLFHLGLGIKGWVWTLRSPSGIGLNGHRDNIPCVGFDRTGDYLASGSLDRSVRLWRCQDGSLIRLITTDRSVWSVKFVHKRDFMHYQRTPEEVEKAIEQQVKRNLQSPEFEDQTEEDEEGDEDDEEYSNGEEIYIDFEGDVTGGDITGDAIPSEETTTETSMQETLLHVFPPLNQIPQEDSIASDPQPSISPTPDLSSPIPTWHDQLLVYTDGRFLVLYDPARPNHIPIRRPTLPRLHPVQIATLCNIQHVPHLSLLLTSGIHRQAWIHRMVYFPDEDIYDLIPERLFSTRLTVSDGDRVFEWPNRSRVTWPWGHYLAGVVVQTMRFEEECDGVYGVRGVRVVVVLERGEMSWWTVNKIDDDGVGVSGIVL